MCYRRNAECVLHFSNTSASCPLMGRGDSKDRWSTEVQLEGCVEIQTEVSPLDKGKGREKDGERQQGVKERGYTRQNP